MFSLLSGILFISLLSVFYPLSAFGFWLQWRIIKNQFTLFLITIQLLDLIMTFFFEKKVSLCIPACLRTHSKDQAGL